MSYIKYREDDIKLWEHNEFLKTGLIWTPEQQVRYFECGYCHELFTDRNELFLHIKSEHNIVSPILCVNGKVVTEDTVLQYVESSVIYKYGFEAPILLDGEKINVLPDEQILNITDWIRETLNLNGECKLSFNDSTIRIELKPFHVESEDLIGKALAEWQRNAMENKSLNPAILNQVTDGDKLFLEGMYNYYIACNAQYDKAKRYDEAYAKLKMLQNIQGIGRCALKVIAFRRNWVNLLITLSGDTRDEFSIVCDFFKNRVNLESNASESKEKELYLEDEIAHNLDLIVKFQKGLYDEIEKEIPSLEKISQMENQNVTDQLKLIKAKLENIKGNNRMSRRCVESINNEQMRQIGIEAIAFNGAN